MHCWACQWNWNRMAAFLEANCFEERIFLHLLWNALTSIYWQHAWIDADLETADRKIEIVWEALGSERCPRQSLRLHALLQSFLVEALRESHWRRCCGSWLFWNLWWRRKIPCLDPLFVLHLYFVSCVSVRCQVSTTTTTTWSKLARRTNELFFRRRQCLLQP